MNTDDRLPITDNGLPTTDNGENNGSFWYPNLQRCLPDKLQGCGFPTCLAFAMKLAAKQVDLALCPTVSRSQKPSSLRLRLRQSGRLL
ncbi:MAG: hypothetical protein H6656_01250 [Ardenticatenaceae bacterium]|nr:hypothetical protein [Ardenticatenaceae bacterium]